MLNEVLLHTDAWVQGHPLSKLALDLYLERAAFYSATVCFTSYYDAVAHAFTASTGSGTRVRIPWYRKGFKILPPLYPQLGSTNRLCEARFWYYDCQPAFVALTSLRTPRTPSPLALLPRLCLVCQSIRGNPCYPIAMIDRYSFHSINSRFEGTRPPAATLTSRIRLDYKGAPVGYWLNCRAYTCVMKRTPTCRFKGPTCGGIQNMVDLL